MIVIYYMNWNGTITELNEWEEQQKKHWAKVPDSEFSHRSYVFQHARAPLE